MKRRIKNKKEPEDPKEIISFLQSLPLELRKEVGTFLINNQEGDFEMLVKGFSKMFKKYGLAQEKFSVKRKDVKMVLMLAGELCALEILEGNGQKRFRVNTELISLWTTPNRVSCKKSKEKVFDEVFRVLYKHRNKGGIRMGDVMYELNPYGLIFSMLNPNISDGQHRNLCVTII
jgi:hypothetical protein